MKDLHTHLLYGIDDGSKSLEESVKLLKQLTASGITEIMVTPHYIENSKYMCNNKDKKKLLDELKKAAKDNNIDVKLYLGNEVFYTSHFIELIENKEVSTLNNSRYLLFEFPMHSYYSGAGEIISKIISKGCVPILAHPERYEEFQENPDLAEEYLRMGLLLQGNSTSLFGKYGRKPKKILKYYIKKGWISFLGTDTHHDYKYKTKKLEKKLLRLNKDKEYIHDLLEGNFDRVVNDEDIAMIR